MAKSTLPYKLAFCVCVIALTAPAGTAPATAQEMLGQLQTKRQRLQYAASGSSAAAPRQPGLDPAREAYLKEDFALALSLSAQSLSGHLSAAEADEALYLKGSCLMKLNRPDEAITVFRMLQNRPVRGWYQSMAALGIGDSLNVKHDFTGSLKAYQAAIESDPNSEAAELAREAMSKISLRPSVRSSIEAVPTSKELPYTLQAGSFSQEVNALSLQKKLSASRYDVTVEKAAVGGIWRVRIGRFSSYRDALPLQRRLKADGYSSKIINRVVYT